jgi:molybdate transport system ATP-binding protein
MLSIDVVSRLAEFTLETRFSADAGVTVLFGPSGSGKSSVINMIAGLLKPERGRIVVNGRVLFDSAEGIDVAIHRRRIGYVFQEGRLFPHLNVRQNLLFGRWFSARDERYTDIGQVVEMLGIGGLLARRPRDLSGGEKQRVAIGRALLASPRVLLMDEPLASLDPRRKEEILPFLERLKKTANIPIVYVSHSVEEVTRLADTLVLLSGGRVLAAGLAADLMSRVDLPASSELFEAGAVVETTVEGHDEASGLTGLSFEGGVLRVPRIGALPGTAVRVRIRARDVALATEPPSGISILNILPGRIEEIGRTDGTFSELRVKVGETAILARITRRSLQDLSLSAGSRVHVLVKAVAVERNQ